MPRRLRYIPEGGSLVEVTCRTAQGRYLFRPSPELNEIIHGLLGYAQGLNNVRVCLVSVLSSHFQGIGLRPRRPWAGSPGPLGRYC